MKTAMQELIELLELNDKNEPMPYLIDSIKQVYMSKEKEQICNAYTDGLEGPYLGAEEYYYDNYNQSIKKITITENNNQQNL